MKYTYWECDVCDETDKFDADKHETREEERWQSLSLPMVAGSFRVTLCPGCVISVAEILSKLTQCDDQPESWGAALVTYISDD